MPFKHYELNLKTNKRNEFIDITQKITDIILSNNIIEGTTTIFVPHTTAAVTINENADPDVKKDILNSLKTLIPEKNDYFHIEGNSDAHIKASLLGQSEVVIIKNKKLVLGRWQGIFFCEFDGPRNRKLHVNLNF